MIDSFAVDDSNVLCGPVVFDEAVPACKSAVFVPVIQRWLALVLVTRDPHGLVAGLELGYILLKFNGDLHPISTGLTKQSVVLCFKGLVEARHANGVSTWQKDSLFIKQIVL